MKRLLDYDEMQELLSSLDNSIIEKQNPIGYSTFGYAIDHYTYGNGKYHVIITGGTHSSELISNVFVIRFMEKLSKKEIFIDPKIYTIHFIPFVNPEGTIIVTSAIRTLISKDMPEDAVQTYCLAYYRNCQIEGDYAINYKDNSIKLQQMMFRHADYNCLDDKHKALKESLKSLFQKYDLPEGCLINWSSNGRGVDLNSNVESSNFIDRITNGEKIYDKLHLNNIIRSNPGPVGCPYYEIPGEIEKENEALFNFYNKINTENDFIGSLIYHSCGGLVYYLDGHNKINPWAKNDSYAKNDLKLAKVYASSAGYKLISEKLYTTMDAKIRTLFPVTLLIELGRVRATPLAQFMDFDLPGSGEDFKYVYTKIMTHNTNAILDTLPAMLEAYKNKF